MWLGRVDDCWRRILFAHAILDGAPVFRIELFEIGIGPKIVPDQIHEIGRALRSWIVKAGSIQRMPKEIVTTLKTYCGSGTFAEARTRSQVWDPSPCSEIQTGRLQAASPREAVLSRGDLTDAEWHILNPLLPDRGECGLAVADNRRELARVTPIKNFLLTPLAHRPTTMANFFYNIASQKIGQVGIWDAIGFSRA
jgi:hypothetical protein